MENLGVAAVVGAVPGPARQQSVDWPGMGEIPYAKHPRAVASCRAMRRHTSADRVTRDSSVKSVRRLHRRLLAIGVLASVVVLSGCSSNTYLPALLDDPMASYEAEGVSLIEAWEQEEGHSLVTDKPVHAEVERLYQIADQNQADQVLADAVAAAESHGWQIAPSSTTPTLGYRAAKELPPGDGRLRVSLVPADPLNEPQSPPVLRIVLDFGSVRFDSTTTSNVEEG